MIMMNKDEIDIVKNKIYSYMNNLKLNYRISSEIMDELIFYGNSSIDLFVYSDYVPKYIILLYKEFISKRDKLMDRYYGTTKSFVNSIMEKLMIKRLLTMDNKSHTVDLIKGLFKHQFDVKNIYLRAYYVNFYIEIHSILINYFNDSHTEVVMFHALMKNDIDELVDLLESGGSTISNCIQIMISYLEEEFYHKDGSFSYLYFSKNCDSHYMLNILKKIDNTLDINTIKSKCEEFLKGNLKIDNSYITHRGCDRLMLESSICTNTWNDEDFAFCHNITIETYNAYMHKVYRKVIALFKNDGYVNFDIYPKRNLTKEKYMVGNVSLNMFMFNGNKIDEFNYRALGIIVNLIHKIDINEMKELQKEQHEIVKHFTDIQSQLQKCDNNLLEEIITFSTLLSNFVIHLNNIKRKG